MRLPAIAAALLLGLPALAAGPKPNPADYPIKVHVVATRLTWQNGFNQQVLYAYVDGQYEVLSATWGVPLKPGDYAAKVSREDRKPDGHDVEQELTLLFSDGSTRTYTVAGFGLIPGTNP